VTTFFADTAFAFDAVLLFGTLITLAAWKIVNRKSKKEGHHARM
jgi:hypothetical protein